MAEISCKLKDGLKLEGKGNQVAAILRDATAGELIAARKASERIIETENGGIHLVVSPSEMTRAMLCLQVVRIGEIPGPLSVDLFNKLSALDVSILDDAVQKLDRAALKEVERRGRSDTAG